MQHAHLETHGSITWLGEDGRLHVRTSTQTPHLTKAKLAYLLELYPERIHLYSERVGGGFGGKQEMLSEELCALATLRTGRPVKWEWTRTEEFVGGVSRHPMKVTIKIGARKNGTLTAIQIRNVSNTGAYGNHGGETLACSLGSSLMTYRCANKKGLGLAVYTNTVPSGAFRGYGATQTAFAVEAAMDEVARQLGIDPFEMRRINMVRANDPLHSIWPGPVNPRSAATAWTGALTLSRRRSRPVEATRNRKATVGWKARASPFMRRIARRPSNTAPKQTSPFARTAPITSPSALPSSATAASTASARSPPPSSKRQLVYGNDENPSGILRHRRDAGRDRCGLALVGAGVANEFQIASFECPRWRVVRANHDNGKPAASLKTRYGPFQQRLALDPLHPRLVGTHASRPSGRENDSEIHTTHELRTRFPRRR